MKRALLHFLCFCSSSLQKFDELLCQGRTEKKCKGNQQKDGKISMHLLSGSKGSSHLAHLFLQTFVSNKISRHLLKKINQFPFCLSKNLKKKSCCSRAGDKFEAKLHLNLSFGLDVEMQFRFNNSKYGQDFVCSVCF